MTYILNLGVLAHVDAGKTSLTERILFQTGAIATLGSVDTGTTHTDSLELEQQRGITIRAAVASALWIETQINLIDTPGHPDFIAEVERSLSVLDAVVLVVSAVEGVQPQTRRLARAIRSLGLPCVIFCNKIDRSGAREDSLLREISTKLGWSLVPLVTTRAIGTRDASVDISDLITNEAVIESLADHDDDLLTAWLNGDVTHHQVNTSLIRCCSQGDVVPVVFGSAMTGVGVDALLDVLVQLTPANLAPSNDLAAQVFKIERDPRGERLVWMRVWNGTIRSRSDVFVQRSGLETAELVGKITRLQRSTPTGLELVNEAGTGEIVLVHGVPGIHVGESVGEPHGDGHRLFVPVFETVVRERNNEDRHRLREALIELADQDPFISLRHDARSGLTSVRLFGDVQKEVIESNLLSDHGVGAIFEDSTVVCMERPRVVADAVERMGKGNPFAAGVGLRITPADEGSGVQYQRTQQSLGRLPLAMYVGIEESVRAMLAEGIGGWEVTDILVELTFVEYSDPVTIVSDFRNLTPLVLASAIQTAGTHVCEPIQQFRLTVPDDLLPEAIRILMQGQAIIAESMVEGESAIITGTIPAGSVPMLERHLPGVSRGEGDLDHWHDCWRPISGDAPARARTDHNPFNRAEYLSRVAGRM